MVVGTKTTQTVVRFTGVGRPHTYKLPIPIPCDGVPFDVVHLRRQVYEGKLARRILQVSEGELGCRSLQFETLP